MCFAKENEEFRTRYDSYSKEIEYYTDRVEQIFGTIGIDHDYTRYGIQRNVEEWYSAKEPIFEILRNHPMWNEEAKAIVFLRDEIRKADANKFKTDLDFLTAYAKKKLKSANIEPNIIADLAISAISGSAEKEITDEEAEMLNRIGYYKEMRGGTKRSRIINAIFKDYPIGEDYKIDVTKFVDEHEEGDRSYQSYNKLFAQVADDTNPLKIKRITILSANICDFLLMSNGNSWSSCHFINSSGAYQGCYKAGTLSYSNDSSSMIFYTLPDTYQGTDWFMEDKITRQMFFYQNGLLLQSRLYPKGGDVRGEIYTDYRAVVQDIISKCLDIPNLWKKCEDGWDENVSTYEDSFHYRDYEEYPGECIMTFNKEMENEIKNGMNIGGRSYCVDCGDERLRYDSDDCSELQCSDCINDRYECVHCGCIEDYEDNVHMIDGDYYCEDCCFYCEIHNEWEIRYDYGHDCRNEVCINGSWYTMCDDALIGCKVRTILKPLPFLVKGLGTRNLDIKVENSTGKIYVYTNTMFEMNKNFS